MEKAKEVLEVIELISQDEYGRENVTGEVLQVIQDIGLDDDIYAMQATMTNQALTMYFVDEDDDVITCMIMNDEFDVPIAVLVPGQEYPIVLDIEGLVPQDEDGWIDFSYDGFRWMNKSFIKTIFTAGSIGSDDQYGEYGEALALINGRKGVAITLRSPQSMHPAVTSLISRELQRLEYDEYERTFIGLNNFSGKMRDVYGI